MWLKIGLNAVRLPKFELVNGISSSRRKIMVKDFQQRSGLAWFCACAESCVVFNTGPYTVLPDNSILITANMQSQTGFPSSHQLKSYVASKSRLKLAARAVPSADAGLLVLKVESSELELIVVFHFGTLSLAVYHRATASQLVTYQLLTRWVECVTSGPFDDLTVQKIGCVTSWPNEFDKTTDILYKLYTMSDLSL